MTMVKLYCLKKSPMQFIQSRMSRLRRNLFCVGVLAVGSAGITVAQTGQNHSIADPYDRNNRDPDERFKADILLVVAHPDDEIMAAAYVAREIEAGKRVAVVWTTRGDGGTNSIGPEQASAMGDIREVEAMRAAASLGVVNMWDLGGPDTPTQNPLESLETCKHGSCLDRLVRIVRLTRPEVILTWLPLGVTGENHGDHQAAGVLATEAFDLAGNPVEFAEQVTPASEPNQNQNRLEGLRPWQPQKIYYFSNPTHYDFFKGQGPEYSATDISSKRNRSYGQIAAEEFIIHRTQGGGRLEEAIREHGMEALEHPIPLLKPTQFIRGKSLVGGSTTGDVFEGVKPEGIPYQAPPALTIPKKANATIELGGPWNYYHLFWRMHGIEHLATLIPNELTVQVGTTLRIPLIINNPTDQPITINLKAVPPDGWRPLDLPSPVIVGPRRQYFVRMQAIAPASKINGWQQFSVSADEQGHEIGTVVVRVELASWALPQ
jgi:LmbE family N-acetylglucosaminyl deacetylase